LRKTRNDLTSFLSDKKPNGIKNVTAERDCSAVTRLTSIGDARIGGEAA